MSDGFKSHIRTWWPIILGQFTTWIVAALAAQVGIDVPRDAAYAVVSAVVTALVYSLGRWLESRTVPWVAALGRFIVGLGLPAPTYPPLGVSSGHSAGHSYTR